MLPLVLKPRTCRNRSKRLSGRFFIRWILALVLFSLGSLPVEAQKRVTKTLLNTRITSIAIDADLCYRIILETVDSNEVTIEARMDGEYQRDLLVLFREDGNTLFIEPEFSPQFRLPNDKLGAHKVVSISMRVQLPRHQNVQLTASSCEVRATGAYRDLGIVFNEGSCHLSHLAENTTVRTGSAPIQVFLTNGVVEATSRYGQVQLDPVPRGDHYLKLTSNHGDISVRSSL